jgi:hypothetical protein
LRLTAPALLAGLGPGRVIGLGGQADLGGALDQGNAFVDLWFGLSRLGWMPDLGRRLVSLLKLAEATLGFGSLPPENDGR